MKIKKLIKKLILARMDVNPLDRFVPDINLDCTRKQKRVLVAYIDFFRASRDVESGSVHTNRFELFQIIRCFIKMGYVIDVCSCEEKEALPIIRNKKYNVIFGMGEVFRNAIESHEDAFSILYLTENPYEVSQQKEQERIDYLYERKKVKWQIERTGRVFYKDDEQKADAVLCMCNPDYLKHTGESVRQIIPSTFFNPSFQWTFERKKITNFLVLGTAGFVHKGIDILVEVFEKHEEWNLYLCGHNNTKIMEKLGYHNPYGNIHDCGYIDVNDDVFLGLVSKCTFILLPSCSEGISTAVLTGACHGLIPIVTKEAGVSFLQQWMIELSGYLVEDIESTLLDAVKLSQKELRQRSFELCEYIADRFSLNEFTKNFEIALSQLLG